MNLLPTADLLRGSPPFSSPSGNAGGRDGEEPFPTTGSFPAASVRKHARCPS